MTVGQKLTFAVDRRLCVRSWGDDISELTGQKKSAVLGKKYYRSFPRIMSGDRDCLLTVIEEKKKRVSLKGYRFYCPLDRLHADITIEPLKNKRGVMGALVTLSNISVCSRAENLLSERRFIDIGKTASSLAHGVRNPLNAIKGAVVYLTEKYQQDPALIEFAGIMKEEIARLDNFVSRFLSTSLFDPCHSLVDVNAIVKKIEVFTSFQSHAHKIETLYEYGKLPKVMANAFQLEQAILNIVNNAMEAMGSGGQLKVSTQMENHSRPESILLEVSDSGAGILEASPDAPLVAKRTRGRGFGLFITREILQSYGGSMEMNSKKGGGTVARLYLPVQGKKKTDVRN
jgi:two-component system nitrogen regulation sensor histidine kinase GlnL